MKKRTRRQKRNALINNIVIAFLFLFIGYTAVYAYQDTQTFENEEEITYTVLEVPDADQLLQIRLERLSERYGVSIELASAIIYCESGFKATARNQNIKDGHVWSTDHGYWQINDYYHEVNALSLGFDIYNEVDNLEYGFYLLSTSGSDPWIASKPCWSRMLQ